MQTSVETLESLKQKATLWLRQGISPRRLALTLALDVYKRQALDIFLSCSRSWFTVCEFRDPWGQSRSRTVRSSTARFGAPKAIRYR